LVDRRVNAAAPPGAAHWLAVLDHLFVQMIDQQERKVLDLARQAVPGLTPEDLRNPHDFAALARDPDFNYEDGMLAGLRGAHMAVRAELRRAALEDVGRET
jgi:hypothetical protein